MMAAYTPTAYYCYLGGLTTPTCDETVNWFVASAAIGIP